MATPLLIEKPNDLSDFGERCNTRAHHQKAPSFLAEFDRLFQCEDYRTFFQRAEYFGIPAAGELW